MRLALLASVALPAGAARADCTAMLAYVPDAVAAVPGVSGPAALVLGATLLGPGWQRLRARHGGPSKGAQRATRIGSGLMVFALASVISTQL